MAVVDSALGEILHGIPVRTCDRPAPGPFAPCQERVWLHYHAGVDSFGVRTRERYDELGRYCAGCRAALVYGWQERNLERVITATNRCPDVPRELPRLRPRDLAGVA